MIPQCSNTVQQADFYDGLNSIQQKSWVFVKIGREKKVFKQMMGLESMTDICYDLQLSSGCNLGKDLSKEQRNDQLVKYKDTEQYLQLYIPSDYEEYVQCT